MSARRPRIAVIMGGDSSERPVSLKSGGAVAQALDPGKYHVVTYDPPSDLLRLVDDADSLDAALIMLHGRGGEDGCMQGLLDLLGVPYQCAGVLGCALAMNKVMAKERFRQFGLPVADDFVFEAGQPGAAEEALRRLGLPLVIKPACEGSSFGVTICQQPEQIAPAIVEASAKDSLILAEKCIIGREITCGVIGEPDPKPLPLVEISPGPGHAFFDYQAKYTPGASREVCPAPLDATLTARIQELGVLAHQALGLRRYSRADFILGPAGPVLLEVNTIPGMTETSLLPQAAAAAGMDYAALVEALLQLALQSGGKLARKER